MAAAACREFSCKHSDPVPSCCAQVDGCSSKQRGCGFVRIAIHSNPNVLLIHNRADDSPTLGKSRRGKSKQATNFRRNRSFCSRGCVALMSSRKAFSETDREKEIKKQINPLFDLHQWKEERRRRQRCLRSFSASLSLSLFLFLSLPFSLTHSFILFPLLTEWL